MMSQKKSCKTFGILIVLLIILSQTPHQAHSNPAATQSSWTEVHLKVSLVDGSLIMGIAQNNHITMNHIAFRRMTVPLSKVKTLEINPDNKLLQITLINNDQISGGWIGENFTIKTIIGLIDIPINVLKSIEITEVVLPQRNSRPNIYGKSSPLYNIANLENVAFGKYVLSRQGNWQDNIAAHLTDHDLRSLAFPGSSTLDYEIDLQRKTETDNSSNTTYQIEHIVIHWGVYGAPYLGKRDVKGGWAPPSGFPGQYVTQYLIQYQDDDSKPDQWKTIHECNVSPNLEDSEYVDVILYAAPSPEYTNRVDTCIKNLNIRRVTKLRLIAKGEHWIGLHELTAYGKIENDNSHPHDQWYLSPTDFVVKSHSIINHRDFKDFQEAPNGKIWMTGWSARYGNAGPYADWHAAFSCTWQKDLEKYFNNNPTSLHQYLPMTDQQIQQLPDEVRFAKKIIGFSSRQWSLKTCQRSISIGREGIYIFFEISEININRPTKTAIKVTNLDLYFRPKSANSECLQIQT
ncbi:MAG: hypothetical protein GY869_12970, partial [Planctomycetes bacterium]|nr:hypothetical protein [Planctomycetota bacterium]